MWEIKETEPDDVGLECQTKYFGLVEKEKAPQVSHCWRCFNIGVTRSELLFKKIDPTNNYTQYELKGRHRSQENQLICVSQRILDSDRKCNSTWLEKIRVLLDRVTKMPRVDLVRYVFTQCSIIKNLTSLCPLLLGSNL